MKYVLLVALYQQSQAFLSDKYVLLVALYQQSQAFLSDPNLSLVNTSRPKLMKKITIL